MIVSILEDCEKPIYFPQVYDSVDGMYKWLCVRIDLTSGVSTALWETSENIALAIKSESLETATTTARTFVFNPNDPTGTRLNRADITRGRVVDHKGNVVWDGEREGQSL